MSHYPVGDLDRICRLAPGPDGGEMLVPQFAAEKAADRGSGQSKTRPGRGCFFKDEKMRTATQEMVAGAIAEDTRVIVGHSLGSVVAYEVLFAHSHQQVRALVTLGSPLGLRNVVFDRLRPAPAAVPGSNQVMGAWPPVRMWANVADTGDIVAAVEDLRPLFGADIRQRPLA